MKIAHELSNQKCIICGPSFETKGKLKSHTSNVYENKCHKCKATFDYKKSLKNHMKIAQVVFHNKLSFYRIEAQFMKKLTTFITELCFKYSCI